MRRPGCSELRAEAIHTSKEHEMSSSLGLCAGRSGANPGPKINILLEGGGVVLALTRDVQSD